MYKVRLMSKVSSCPMAMNSSMLDSTAAALKAAAVPHSRRAASHTSASVARAP